MKESTKRTYTGITKIVVEKWVSVSGNGSEIKTKAEAHGSHPSPSRPCDGDSCV